MAQWEQLPELDRNDYKPLYVQLSELLAKYILSNKLCEGDLLPSENELLSRYEVSRSTVRQAMQHLEAQEIISKIRGKGTFVSDSKNRKCVRGFQNFEETLAEQGLILSNILLQFESVYPSPDCAKNLRIAPGSQVFLIRRLKVSNGEPLALEERFLPAEIGSQFTGSDFKEKPVFNIVETHAELEIVRVTYTITATLLTEEEAKLLKVDIGTPALRRMGAYHGHGGRPIMYGSLVFLPDKTELQYEFQKNDNMWVIMPVR